MSLKELITDALKELKNTFFPLVLAGSILGASNVQARIDSFDGYAKKSNGQPASGIAGHRVLCQKFPPGTSRTVAPDGGGLFSVSRLSLGTFNLLDTVTFHLYNQNAPSESANYVYVVTDTFPGQYVDIYVPEIYEDSSAVPNRVYALSLQLVISPVPDTTRKKCEFWLRKNPSDRDIAYSIKGPPWNTADTFHFNLEYLAQNANHGDTVDMHLFTNDTTYKDTWAVVTRYVGRFLNDADRPVQVCTLEIHPRPPARHDIGIEQLFFKWYGIYLPLPCTLDVGDSVIPAITVKNYGNRTEEVVPLRFLIEGNVIYDYSDTIFNLPNDSTETLDLTPWCAAIQGNYTASGIYVPGDTNPANDTLRQEFRVGPGQGAEENSSRRRQSQINQSIIPYSRLIETIENNELEVYNSTGRRVAKKAAGTGVYFIRQTLPRSEKTKKVIVLKK